MKMRGSAWEASPKEGNGDALDDLIHAHLEAPAPFRANAQVRKDEARLVFKMEQARDDAACDMLAPGPREEVELLVVLLTDERSKAEERVREGRRGVIRVGGTSGSHSLDALLARRRSAAAAAARRRLDPKPDNGRRVDGAPVCLLARATHSSLPWLLSNIQFVLPANSEFQFA